MVQRAQTDLMAVGILMMLIANFLFATHDTTVKWMLTLGFPALQLAVFRYAGHFAISAGLTVWHRDWARLKGGGRPGLVALPACLSLPDIWQAPRETYRQISTYHLQAP